MSFITMTSWWALWRLKSPASRLFTQPFLVIYSKKTWKLRITGLCVGNSPMTGEFPSQRASNAEMFPFDDVIMSSGSSGAVFGSDNALSPVKRQSFILPFTTYCRGYPQHQTSVEVESTYNVFHSRYWFWKCSLQNGGHLSLPHCVGVLQSAINSSDYE